MLNSMMVGVLFAATATRFVWLVQRRKVLYLAPIMLGVGYGPPPSRVSAGRG